MLATFQYILYFSPFLPYLAKEVRNAIQQNVWLVLINILQIIDIKFFNKISLFCRKQTKEAWWQTMPYF